MSKGSKVESVGVFVNEPLSKMVGFQKKAKFQTFQLHGEEGPEVLSKIDASLKLLKLNPVDLNRIDNFIKAPKSKLLIDAPPSLDGCYGGRGEKLIGVARTIKKR